MIKIKSSTRVKCALSRINNAIYHLEAALTEQKGHYHKWTLETTLYEIKNAKTLLSNIKHEKKTNLDRITELLKESG